MGMHVCRKAHYNFLVISVNSGTRAGKLPWGQIRRLIDQS
jgi:hypothetical protein